jgi:hypothetical protein
LYLFFRQPLLLQIFPDDAIKSTLIMGRESN